MKLASQADVVKDPDKDQKILEVATRAFAEQGFSNVDTQTIADLAGVGKGTVYRYYKSKEELFLAVADNGMKRLEKCCLDAIEGVDDTIVAFRAAAMAYAAFYQKHPELVEILIQERAAFRGSIPDTHMVYRQKNRGIFEDMLRQGIAGGVIRDINVREITNTMGNALFGTVVCGCIEGSAKQLKRMAKHATEIVLRGIVVDPASLEQGD